MLPKRPHGYMIEGTELMKNACFIHRATLSAASIFALAAAAPAAAQAVSDAAGVERETVAFDIPAQPLDKALVQFSRQSKIAVMAPTNLTNGKMSTAVDGDLTPAKALSAILQGTDLEAERRNGGAFGLARRGAQVEEIERPEARAAAPEVEADEIVVTGSNIEGIDSASPVFVFDQGYIESTGFSTVGELIDSLPFNFGSVGLDTVSSPDRQTGNNRGSGTTVNLRGLGAGSTLVLLNGRRMAPSGEAGGFVDISTIPLGAIERVEVLSDGASAIYGTDAVGGVVNFITRTDFDGAETVLRYGTVTQGDLDEFRGAQSLGTSWASGNAFLTYEYFDRDNLRAEDRDFTDIVDADLAAGSERHSVFGSVRQSLLSNTDVFATVLYSTRDASFRTNATGSQPRLRESTTEQLDLALGAEIQLSPSWDLDLSGSYSQNDLEFDITINVPLFGEAKSDLFSLNALASGTIVELPGGPLALALGGEYREETFEFFRRGTLEAEGERNVVALFGEINVPLVSESNTIPGVTGLDLSIAGRFEDYSDFGSTTRPKVGIRWAPFDSLVLRSTYSSSFRAPNLSDLSETINQAVLFNSLDAASTLTLGLSGNNSGLGPEEADSLTIGFDFSPKMIGGLDIGGTYYQIEYSERIDNATTSVIAPLLDPSFFAPIITFDPAADTVSALIADAEARGRFLNFGDNNVGPLIPVVPADVGAIVDLRLSNLSATKVSGLDVTATYAFDTDVGEFVVGATGSHIFEYENRLVLTSPSIDIADTIFNPSDFRLRSNVSWGLNGFGADVFVNYTDDYIDNRSATDVKVNSFTTVDLQLRYDGSGAGSSGIMSGLTFSVSVLNLFNENPPNVAAESFSNLGFDPTNSNPLGRFVAFELKKNW